MSCSPDRSRPHSARHGRQGDRGAVDRAGGRAVGRQLQRVSLRRDSFRSPLLYWLAEAPGFFHIWGTSKIAKSLAGAIGQSVWGRPKVPGEADAFGASWTATAVGLERYAVLRSDVGAYLDEIGEGAPKAIRPAVYGSANGSTKLR